MTQLSHQQLQDCADRLRQAHARADETGDWISYVDDIYSPDCPYICEYGGTMTVAAHGREQIKATHYGRDMQHGWEGWTFPYMGIYVGTDNRVITHWMNRGPGTREDGRFFETPGISFLTFDQNQQICHQFDMFDIAHQMKLCDELEAAGLLSEALKTNWVIPTKQRIRDMLDGKA